MNISDKTYPEPTAEEIAIVEHLRSLKHDPIACFDEKKIMDILSKYVIGEYGREDIAMEFDTDKCPISLKVYRVSGDGKQRATKRAQKENNIEIRQFSKKTCGVLNGGQLIAVVSYVEGALQEKGLIEDLLKRLMEDLVQGRPEMAG